MHRELFPATLNHYKNLVRFVYKDDPIPELHPWAIHAAVDANCLAAQSGEVYWTYVDYLHSHGEEISGPDPSKGIDLPKSLAALDRIAREEATLGKLDETRLDACIGKQDETLIQASNKLANDLGIDGTPAVYVNGERVSGGAVPQDEPLDGDRPRAARPGRAASAFRGSGACCGREGCRTCARCRQIVAMGYTGTG